MNIDQAYSYCYSIAKGHYENFPVASTLVPAKLRRHVVAIYAFARRADDIADEGDALSDERLETLSLMREALRTPSDSDPVYMALHATINEFRLPLNLFDRLLDAFASDVLFRGPETWQDLLAYCNNSANPIGEALLRLDNGGKEPLAQAIHASNQICTALQITNFLQDVSIDIQRGRNYLPIPDSEAIKRTAELFDDGSRILQHLHSWRLRLEVRSIIFGGKAMLFLCSQRSDRMLRPTLSLTSMLMYLLKR